MTSAKSLEDLKLQARQARKQILDLLEVSLAEPQWSVLRSKVMEVFGRYGLEGEIDNLIRECGRTGDGNANARFGR